MLGDGDIQTISLVNLSESCGPGIIVAKECVGHVAKHFYK